MTTHEKIQQFARLSSAMQLALNEVEVHWAPQNPPATIAMGDIAVALTANLDQISKAELEAIFRQAETFLNEGDEALRESITTGFFEALLAESSAKRFDFSQISPMLGDKSRKYCRAWDVFCGITTIGL
jgi:hypothetical protein